MELNELATWLDLGLVLTSHGLTGEAVEVGVGTGISAFELLGKWPGHLHLVDSWLPEQFYTDTTQAQRYHECRARLAQHAQRVTYHPGLSHDMVGRFANGSLDYIFIDCCHHYPWVVVDLHLWFPKLKMNGLFAGHDYISPRRGVGVKLAVDEFAARHGFNVVAVEHAQDDVAWALWKTREMDECLR